MPLLTTTRTPPPQVSQWSEWETFLKKLVADVVSGDPITTSTTTSTTIATEQPTTTTDDDANHTEHQRTSSVGDQQTSGIMAAEDVTGDSATYVFVPS